jgi:hypothetical protein
MVAVPRVPRKVCPGDLGDLLAAQPRRPVPFGQHGQTDVFGVEERPTRLQDGGQLGALDGVRSGARSANARVIPTGGLVPA